MAPQHNKPKPVTTLEERRGEGSVLQRDPVPLVQGPGWNLEEFRVLRIRRP